MTRKRVGQGLVEAFSETCEHCHGRGFIVHEEPNEKGNQRPDAGEQQSPGNGDGSAPRSRRKRGGAKEPVSHVPHPGVPVLPEAREAVKATLATIAAAAAHAHEHEHDHDAPAATDQEAPVLEVSEMETEQVAPPAPAFDVFAELAVTHPGGAATAVDGAPSDGQLADGLSQEQSDEPTEELELTPVPADVFETDEQTDERRRETDDASGLEHEPESGSEPEQH